MLKVAVIDGNAISRDLLKSVLTNGGHEIVADSSPSPAGIAAMIKLRPQVVCIDIGEANEEGWSKVDTLRHELPKALLFLVSGKFEPATLQVALQRGVHGFIVKPFNTGTVLTTIRNAVIKLARQHRKATAEE
jgi:DNA-binding NarL/FixJ family response regulator